MKTIINKFLTLSFFSLSLLLNSCSSHETVNVSETHLYNNHYGVHQNLYVDSIIQKELLAINKPTEIETPYYSNPEWTTELKMDSDAFLAEDYVEKEAEISYKYQFDKKFYKTAEWRKAEF
jgi:hypothetical protein